MKEENQIWADIYRELSEYNELMRSIEHNNSRCVVLESGKNEAEIHCYDIGEAGHKVGRHPDSFGTPSDILAKLKNKIQIAKYQFKKEMKCQEKI